MKRIICFGDSVTASAGQHEGGRWTSQLHYRLESEVSEGWQVYNRGIGGNTTWQGLDRFETDIKPLLPGYVLIEFGFNDCSVPPGRRIARCALPAFRENLAEIIRMVRAGKGKPIVIVNHPIRAESLGQGNRRTYPKNFAPYQLAIREVAKANRAPVIDLEKEMKKAAIDLDKLLSPDGLHLSAEGNFIYADFVLAGLRQILRV